MRAAAKWLLVLAAVLAVFVASSAVGAAAIAEDSVGQHDKANAEVGFLISGIVEKLLRPLKNLLVAQIDSIIKSIIDQGGMIIGNANDMLDKLVEIIRPFVIRILDHMNDIIGAGVELKERLRMAVEALFDFLGVINNGNKEIIKSMIMYIVDKLLPTVSAEAAVIKARTDVGFLISGIVEKLLRPLKNLLVAQIDSIIKSIIDQGGMIIGNAKQLLDKLVEIIRPFVIRILDHINDIIGAGVELKERLRMAIETLFDYLGVINNANKEIIKSMIKYIVDKLLPTASAEVAVIKAQTDAGYFISGIIDILLRPLKNLLASQINSIIKTIIDQGGLIIGNAKQMIDKLLEIIRPFIIRILDKINDIIGAGVELKERIKMAVEALFNYLGVISNANKEIIKSLIAYIVEKLLPTAGELEIFRHVMTDSPLLLSKIKEHLIAPLIEFARRQVESIVKSLIDQAGIIGDELLRYAGVIAEIIRPHVIRILDLAGNVHGEIEHLRETVREAVASIIGNIGAIGAEGREIVSRLIDLITDILVPKIPANAFHLTASREDAFLIIDRIIGWIVQPILNKLNSILDQIRRLVEDKTDEAKAKLLRLYDELTQVLRDPVIKIIGVLGDIGIEIGDAAKAVKRALELLIDSVSGIHEANKAIFKSILSHIVSSLLKLIEGDAAVARGVFDFSILMEIINRILGPIISTINRILDNLRKQIEDKVGEAADLIRDAVDNLAKLMAPYISKIVEIFIQIGIGSRDLVENVRIILDLIINKLSGIAEANKQLLGQMLGDLLRRIIDIVRSDLS